MEHVVIFALYGFFSSRTVDTSPANNSFEHLDQSLSQWRAIGVHETLHLPGRALLPLRRLLDPVQNMAISCTPTSDMLLTAPAPGSSW